MIRRGDGFFLNTAELPPEWRLRKSGRLTNQRRRERIPDGVDWFEYKFRIYRVDGGGCDGAGCVNARYDLGGGGGGGGGEGCGCGGCGCSGEGCACGDACGCSGTSGGPSGCQTGGPDTGTTGTTGTSGTSDTGTTGFGDAPGGGVGFGGADLGDFGGGWGATAGVDFGQAGVGQGGFGTGSFGGFSDVFGGSPDASTGGGWAGGFGSLGDVGGFGGWGGVAAGGSFGGFGGLGTSADWGGPAGSFEQAAAAENSLGNYAGPISGPLESTPSDLSALTSVAGPIASALTALPGGVLGNSPMSTSSPEVNATMAAAIAASPTASALAAQGNLTQATEAAMQEAFGSQYGAAVGFGQVEKGGTGPGVGVAVPYTSPQDVARAAAAEGIPGFDTQTASLQDVQGGPELAAAVQETITPIAGEPVGTEAGPMMAAAATDTGPFDQFTSLENPQISTEDIQTAMPTSLVAASPYDFTTPDQSFQTAALERPTTMSDIIGGPSSNLYAAATGETNLLPSDQTGLETIAKESAIADQAAMQPSGEEGPTAGPEAAPSEVTGPGATPTETNVEPTAVAAQDAAEKAGEAVQQSGMDLEQTLPGFEGAKPTTTAEDITAPVEQAQQVAEAAPEEAIAAPTEAPPYTDEELQQQAGDIRERQGLFDRLSNIIMPEAEARGARRAETAPIPQSEITARFDPDLANARTPFAQQLAMPETLDRVARFVNAEVGNKSLANQTAFAEMLLNRSDKFYGGDLVRSLSGQALQSYPTTEKGWQGRYNETPSATVYQAITNALSGSNIALGATGNESGKVTTGERAGGLALAMEGERYVYETGAAGQDAQTQQDRLQSVYERAGFQPTIGLPNATTFPVTQPNVTPAQLPGGLDYRPGSGVDRYGNIIFNDQPTTQRGAQTQGVLSFGDIAVPYLSGGSKQGDLPDGIFALHIIGYGGDGQRSNLGPAYDPIARIGDRNGNLFDPTINNYRTDMEIHALPTRSETTAGCVGIPASQYGPIQNAMIQAQRNGEQLYAIHERGNIEIVTANQAQAFLSGQQPTQLATPYQGPGGSRDVAYDYMPPPMETTPTASPEPPEQPFDIGSQLTEPWDIGLGAPPYGWPSAGVASREAEQVPFGQTVQGEAFPTGAVQRAELAPFTPEQALESAMIGSAQSIPPETWEGALRLLQNEQTPLWMSEQQLAGRGPYEAFTNINQPGWLAAQQQAGRAGEFEQGPYFPDLAPPSAGAVERAPLGNVDAYPVTSVERSNLAALAGPEVQRDAMQVLIDAGVPVTRENLNAVIEQGYGIHTPGWLAAQQTQGVREGEFPPSGLPGWSPQQQVAGVAGTDPFEEEATRQAQLENLDISPEMQRAAISERLYTTPTGPVMPREVAMQRAFDERAKGLLANMADHPAEQKKVADYLSTLTPKQQQGVLEGRITGRDILVNAGIPVRMAETFGYLTPEMYRGMQQQITAPIPGMGQPGQVALESSVLPPSPAVATGEPQEDIGNYLTEWPTQYPPMMPAAPSAPSGITYPPGIHETPYPGAPAPFEQQPQPSIPLSPADRQNVTEIQKEHGVDYVTALAIYLYSLTGDPSYFTQREPPAVRHMAGGGEVETKLEREARWEREAQEKRARMERYLQSASDPYQILGGLGDLRLNPEGWSDWMEHLPAREIPTQARPTPRKPNVPVPYVGYGSIEDRREENYGPPRQQFDPEEWANRFWKGYQPSGNNPYDLTGRKPED